MSEENQFEASPEEVAFVVKLRASTQVFTPAEINILKKRRESGQAAGSGAGEGGGDEIDVDSIRPGMSKEKLSEILAQMRRAAG